MQEHEWPLPPNVTEFQRFSDAVGEAAAKAGLTEETLSELLTDH